MDDLMEISAICFECLADFILIVLLTSVVGSTLQTELLGFSDSLIEAKISPHSH